MKSLWPTAIKSIIFVLVTVLLTGILLVSIGGSSSSGRGYSAMFTDVTALQNGDDVRMAGVRIGEVTGIHVFSHNQAKVTFTIDPSDQLSATVTAMIRFRNLVGQRYISLDQGSGSPEQHWPNTQTLGTDRTSPALDLTALFNGFQPLFQALDPQQINTLSFEIIQIFQGEGGTVDDLLNKTASLTSTLADKDQLIGQVIDNLNSVLNTVNSRRVQLTTTISTLRQLTSGLASDRDAIGSAISGIGGLTTSVTSLLEQGRPALQASINSLGALSGNLAANTPELQSFLSNLPTKLNALGRTASYGSWINTYVCSISGRIPVPQVLPYKDPTTGRIDTPAYTGTVGIQPTEARCQG